VPLFEGGWFDLTYNYAQRRAANYTLRVLFANDTNLPGDLHQRVGSLGYPVVNKLQIYSFNTGHGWGKEEANCAEFCNMDHHFYVNKDGHFMVNYPMAGSQTGCQDRVLDGVTPNQWGSWWYGRTGWCSSLDVKPWIMDITSHIDKRPSGWFANLNNTDFSGVSLSFPDNPVLLEALNLPPHVQLVDISLDIAYRGYFNGQDYNPVPATNPQPNGFKAYVRHSSYLVLSGPTYQPAP
jgi:hypothetical protein